MQFDDYLNHSILEIEQKISGVFSSWKKEIKEINPKLIPIFEVFMDGMSGGKRIRGLLVKLGYCLIKPDYQTDIIKAAVAYEVFQTAILIHDDIIDKSEFRRGKKSVYFSLGANHYGISQAICLGDLGFFLALKLINSTHFPDVYKVHAVKSFIDCARYTVFGQMLDVRQSHSHKFISEAEVLDIYQNKTAQYSVTGPLNLGAILAGADESILSKIELFGRNLGLAYQIQDEVLGIFADQETTGKPVSSDIKEGKTTLLLVEARKNANKKQAEIINKLYGDNNITEDEIKILKKAFVDTGALKYSEKRVTEYLLKAKEIIPVLGKNKETKILLHKLVDYLTVRRK